VIKVLDSLKEEYSLDTTRLYVAGLSMGGAGTWGLVKDYPLKFAAGT
jgi:predicted peptidase